MTSSLRMEKSDYSSDNWVTTPFTIIQEIGSTSMKDFSDILISQVLPEISRALPPMVGKNTTYRVIQGNVVAMHITTRHITYLGCIRKYRDTVRIQEFH